MTWDMALSATCSSASAASITETLTARVILDPQSEVNLLLRTHDQALPERVCGLLQHRPRPGFLTDCLSSQLDADRFDYLLRDNLMTGSQYGAYDLEWLLHALTIDPAGDRLAVHARGISAVEAFLQSRYHMYRNVYFHKVVRSAEGMVKLALQRAKRLAVQGRLVWPAVDHTVHAALLGRQLSIDQFTDLDDVSMIHCFKLWARGEDAVLARLCRGLLYRRLFKVIELPAEISHAEAVAMTAHVRELVASAGGDADYDVFYDEPSDTLYETFEPGGHEDARPICVINDKGEATSFAEMSRLPEAFRQQLMFRRLHVAAAYEQAVLGLLGSAS